MQIQTQVLLNGHLQSLHLEVDLLPGMPGVQILGLPERQARDCVPRLKAAILAQGFAWPSRQQVIVNVRPTVAGVLVRELDLAMAISILVVTGQILWPAERANWVILGELNLAGEVLPLAPDWGVHLAALGQECLLGAGSLQGQQIRALSELRELKAPLAVSASGLVHGTEFSRPGLNALKVSKDEAELLAVVALGEHSLLLAGPAGSGKSTLAAALHPLLADPSVREWLEIQKLGTHFGRMPKWRPWVAPHHSTPAISVIGGGSPPHPGEVTRAHGGLLFLDEWLEFRPQVQEALREPCESGEIILARGGEARTYPSRFLLVAASNLCPCGDLLPGEIRRCGLSLIRCRSVLSKLSGPMLDRFDVLHFTRKRRAERTVSLSAVAERLQAAREFVTAQGRNIVNGRLSLSELEAQIPTWLKGDPHWLEGVSERRRRALIRVARSLADLDLAKDISGAHLREAMRMAVTPFLDLRQIFA